MLWHFSGGYNMHPRARFLCPIIPVLCKQSDRQQWWNGCAINPRVFGTRVPITMFWIFFVFWLLVVFLVVCLCNVTMIWFCELELRSVYSLKCATLTSGVAQFWPCGPFLNSPTLKKHSSDMGPIYIFKKKRTTLNAFEGVVLWINWTWRVTSFLTAWFSPAATITKTGNLEDFSFAALKYFI